MGSGSGGEGGLKIKEYVHTSICATIIQKVKSIFEYFRKYNYWLVPLQNYLFLTHPSVSLNGLTATAGRTGPARK